jgi:hypothetical protein
MNPELQRNLWLEATPFRLALILGLLLLVFSATSVAPGRVLTTNGTAVALYWFFAVLWGTRSAALSVVAEIRERTWDGQKLSSIGPWDMVWGKLFGATAANWFGALLCLVFLMATGLSSLTYGLILLALGVFAQAVALLSSLVLIRRNTGNWRLDAFLCQVAGIGAALSYYSLWSSIPAFERAGTRTIPWWGHAFNLSSFHLVSLLLFLAWALVGCWRAMRAELRFTNGPYVWLAYIFYIAIYSAGFQNWFDQRLHLDQDQHPVAAKLTLAGVALLASTYSMVFLEPKDPVRLRWLGERINAGQLYRAFLALDCWMLSYAATMAVGLVLVLLWAVSGNDVSLMVLAMLGFLTRDVAIFVLMRGRVGGKGDFAALGILGALYLLLPMILNGSGLPSLGALFLPMPPMDLSVAAAWLQTAVGVTLALRGVGVISRSRA